MIQHQSVFPMPKCNTIPDVSTKCKPSPVGIKRSATMQTIGWWWGKKHRPPRLLRIYIG